MKEFNLEEAKSGKPVCTSRGKDVRILSFDREDSYYPIVALVKNPITGEEDIESYTNNGRYNKNPIKESGLDLCMKTSTIIRYLNVYKSGVHYGLGDLYKTEEEAKINVHDIDSDYVATVKITFED